MAEKIKDVVGILYITKENADFTDCDGYISLKLKGDSEKIAAMENKEFSRVLLSRCFPFELTEGFLSVTSEDGTEIGIIKSLKDLSEESITACRNELGRKYFTRKILTVEKVREKYGYTTWNVTAEEGKVTFTVHDTYRSITKVTADHLLINDINGNIFEIESLEALPPKSYRQIELYL